MPGSLDFWDFLGFLGFLGFSGISGIFGDPLEVRINGFRRQIRARLAKCTGMRATRAPGSDFEAL